MWKNQWGNWLEEATAARLSGTHLWDAGIADFRHDVADELQDKKTGIQAAQEELVFHVVIDDLSPTHHVLEGSGNKAVGGSASPGERAPSGQSTLRQLSPFLVCHHSDCCPRSEGGEGKLTPVANSVLERVLSSGIKYLTEATENRKVIQFRVEFCAVRGASVRENLQHAYKMKNRSQQQEMPKEAFFAGNPELKARPPQAQLRRDTASPLRRRPLAALVPRPETLPISQ